MVQIYTEKDVLNLVEEFSMKFHDGLIINFRKTTLKNILEDPSIIKSLRNKSGIYFFIQEESVKYVGRALPSVGLGSRIKNQVTAFGDEKWDTVIKDIATEVGVVIFEDPSQWYFISALEHYLIENLGRPVFNKRS